MCRIIQLPKGGISKCPDMETTRLAALFASFFTFFSAFLRAFSFCHSHVALLRSSFVSLPILYMTAAATNITTQVAAYRTGMARII